MPLTIYTGNTAAHQVFTQGVGLRPRRRYEVQMGNFAVANNAVTTTALGTGGAGTCQIIVVHKAAGLGALGHYAGTSDPDEIAQGVLDMVQALGGPPVANVVLAAGESGNSQQQLNYQNGVLARVRTVCPGASVVWPQPPQDDVWGACYYLPLEELVGLRLDSPGDYGNAGHINEGISIHSY